MEVTGELAIKKRVVEDSSISAMAKALFFYILCQNREKYVFVQRNIMDKLNCSRPTFVNAMKELIRKNVLSVFVYREHGRIKGAKYWVVGIDSIQDTNTITTVKNSDVSNFDVNNSDVSNFDAYKNKNIKKKSIREQGEECSPALSNDEQNEIEVVCQDENKTADAVTHMPPETHTFSSSETKANVKDIVIESATVPTMNDFVVAINDSLNEKGLIWGTSQIQYKAEKLYTYYAGKNWINKNGKQITRINVPHLVRYCLTRDKFQPEEVKLKFTPQAQSGGSCIDKLVFSLLDEAFDKSEREKAEKEERHRLFLLEQQRKREEYLKEHQNA